MKKKSLVLKIAALCIASAGFMFVKSSMPSVQVYAMEKLMDEQNEYYSTRPQEREDFGVLNKLWRDNNGNSVVDEVEYLLMGQPADINAIKNGVRCIYRLLNTYPRTEIVKNKILSCWFDLLRLNDGYEGVVIENEEVRKILNDLFEVLCGVGIIKVNNQINTINDFRLSYIQQ